MTKNECSSLWFSQKRLKPGLCLVQACVGKMSAAVCVHRGLGSNNPTQYKVLQGWRREKWGSRNFDYSAFYLIFGTKRENNLQPTRAIV